MDVSTETKSRKKSSDRKLEILRTLVRMMTESENKHITTKSLAAAIGISEAALYRHFPSKAKMYEEIIGFAENYVMTAVNNISSSEYSGLEQAKKLFLALVDIKAKEPGLVFKENLIGSTVSSRPSLSSLSDWPLLRKKFPKATTC